MQKTMKGRAAGSALLLAGALVLTACGGDGESGGADQVTVGTHPVGTAYYNGGTTVASLISDYTDLRASVQPYAGPNAWMPALAEGQVTFGIAGASDPAWAFNGEHGYAQTPRVRIVADAGDLEIVGLVTKADSGIESLADIKGQRVAAGFGGNIAAEQTRIAMMRSVGLTDDDVRLVPVPDVTTSMDAVRRGQVDVGFGLAPTTPAGVDVDAATPLRGLNFADLDPAEAGSSETPDELKTILDEELPGWDSVVIEAGTGYLEDDTVGFTYPVQLVTGESTPDETVAAVMDAIGEHFEDLAEADAAARFTPETLVPGEFFVPYHEASIAYLEEAGEWSETEQTRQEELLGG